MSRPRKPTLPGALATVVLVGLATACDPGAGTNSSATSDPPPTASSTAAPNADAPSVVAGLDLERITISDLQHAMDTGRLSSEQLTGAYLKRIESLNPLLHAVIAVNPDAVSIARDSDDRRRAQRSRGPLEGIPVLVKDNIDTADKQPTTAGSSALLTAEPTTDAFLVGRLRAAGAVIVGKANLSEWANFRSTNQIAGWSATGGQTRNPYVLDRSPCGSSSGSAVAAAAALAAVTIGTETDGSIVCPASATSTVGIKPTVGLVSRSGIVPITLRHDTAGPIARNVADAALTLSAIYGVDPNDPDTAVAQDMLPTDYRSLLDPNSLRGKRIGIWRTGRVGIDPDVDRVFDATVARLRGLGAVVVDNVDVPNSDEVVTRDLLPAVLTEFKHDLNAYLAATPGEHPKDLTELIDYNRRHADTELAGFGQELFEMADKTDGDLTDPTYRAHRQAATDQARRAIDDALTRDRLDAIVTPTEAPAPKLEYQGGGTSFASSTRNSAMAGYPIATVPAGYARDTLPLGLSFIGTRFSDAQLIAYAYAYEQATPARKAPDYLPTLP
ncbi:amidase [Nocardia iowensis]|uniref:Amidase n=1 Tax=Nocardia iowensis TaxID=204891 RepID=A0ABX8RZ42_NOCIO|nr:amidase [Nocardia iowensis]QXN94945.1 amidase [Nocardia iowensis]